MRGISLSKQAIASDPRLRVEDRQPPMRRHGVELLAGKDGPRGKDFKANPMALHPRIPVMPGSRREVEVVARCHA